MSGTSRTAAAVSGGALFLLYFLTLAPDVTWWDSGEFIAAAHSLGIPHPPGVPLYVLLSNVSARVFWFLGPAASVSILSAVCTAMAGGLAAAAITRHTGDARVGIGAAISAGAMSTVWLNATEAEVYAVALLLSVSVLYCAHGFLRDSRRRWILMAAFLISLAAPLHISALVAAPAAILLVASPRGARTRAAAPLTLAGAFILAAGVGRGQLATAAAGLFILIATGFWELSARRDSAERGLPAGFAAVTPCIIAVACVLFLPLRSTWDPLINQGAPDAIAPMLDVLARKQYDVAGLLPRQAPVWLQVGNYFQYLDWQFALGMAPTPEPSAARTLPTILYSALALYGLAALFRRGESLRWPALLLLASASIGVVFYLNLKAGPTFGAGLIPDTASREARERDYFFLLSFWSVGLLAGGTAVRLAAKLPRAGTLAGLAFAALPVFLNYPAVNRRSEPDATLPSRFAHALLESAPVNAVLFVGGDNDTYPLWYLQTARAVRRDVVVITLPLLGADWYRAELSRRHQLFAPSGPWPGLQEAMREIAARASELQRPVLVANTVSAEERNLLGTGWALQGFHYRRVRREVSGGEGIPDYIDVPAVADAARWSESGISNRVKRAMDPIAAQMATFFECPYIALAAARGTADVTRLDLACNFR